MAEDCANPLFVEWLKEWWDVERERNSKAHLTYRKAYQSMKACPVKFQHASEAEQLNGIGPKMCRRLEERHREHCLQQSLPVPQKPSRRARASAGTLENGPTDAEENAGQPPRKRQKTKEYVPQLRSGAYALIKALGELEEDSSQGISKAALIDRAQPYCDASFTVPSDPTKYYTAFKSMETLLKKELVYTQGHPIKRYMLTDDGWVIARKIQSQEQGAQDSRAKKTSNSMAAASKTSTPAAGNVSYPVRSLSLLTDDVLDLSSESEAEVADVIFPSLIPLKDSGPSATRRSLRGSSSRDPIILKPGTFEVKLLLDNREIRTKKDRDYIATELKNKHGVVADVRALPLGDVLWVAKLKPPHDLVFQHSNTGDSDEGSTEIVLDHVLERKRLDDLISSIKDGRLHEQKFRLKKSGMRHVTYLLETIALSSEKQEVYGQSMESIIAQMQIVDGIFVKQTTKMDDTIRYLAQMTESMKQIYQNKDLHVVPSSSLDVATHHNNLEDLRSESPTNTYCITFSAFCSVCDKSDSLTLRDLYLKMLMCIHGVTGEKAIQIQQIWPTPKALTDAYLQLGGDTAAKQTMISDRLGKAIDRKRVTKVLSTKIAEVWAG